MAGGGAHSCLLGGRLGRARGSGGAFWPLAKGCLKEGWLEPVQENRRRRGVEAGDSSKLGAEA